LIKVRYFAAASAAVGLEEEVFKLPSGSTVEDLLAAMVAAERPEPPAGTLALKNILTRCSYLLNEVAVRDRRATLIDDDILDVLPPFAGG
jgi:molybdopterin synthase sulfur carrier subunit